jgi:hypothetical protein
VIGRSPKDGKLSMMLLTTARDGGFTVDVNALMTVQANNSVPL